MNSGSRRLSVGALVGLNVTTSPAKDEMEVNVNKKSKAQVASSYGSTPGLTQGGVTRIRNKTIPIINPIVKSSNWNATASKKGIFKLVPAYFVLKKISLVFFGLKLELPDAN